MTTNGGIAIIRGNRALLVAGNPTTASALAASADLGVLTVAGLPPWTSGARFRLDGAPLAPPPTINEGFCCTFDGTTDGQFNYSVRQDSTLLEPAGSRPLAPPGIYRFERDWSRPQLLFAVAAEGIYYGITFDRHTDSFWLTRRARNEAVIEQWSRDGRHLSTPVRVPAAVFTGIAADPLDASLWVSRQQFAGTGRERLENYDASGRLLAIVDITGLAGDWLSSGAEFAWIDQR
jgi:hypothetical protein